MVRIMRTARQQLENDLNALGGEKRGNGTAVSWSSKTRPAEAAKLNPK